MCRVLAVAALPNGAPPARPIYAPATALPPMQIPFGARRCRAYQATNVATLNRPSCQSLLWISVRRTLNDPSNAVLAGPAIRVGGVRCHCGRGPQRWLTARE